MIYSRLQKFNLDFSAILACHIEETRRHQEVGDANLSISWRNFDPRTISGFQVAAKSTRPGLLLPSMPKPKICRLIACSGAPNAGPIMMPVSQSRQNYFTAGTLWTAILLKLFQQIQLPQQQKVVNLVTDGVFTCDGATGQPWRTSGLMLGRNLAGDKGLLDGLSCPVENSDHLAGW